MKVLKTFAITLIVILALGAVFLLVQKSKTDDVSAPDSAEITESAAQSASSESGNSNSSKANPITKAIVSEAIDTYIEKSDGKVKEIAESMSEEDKDTVTEIIANNVSLDAISDVQSYISEGDTSALLDYATENLSEEETEKLSEIMQKYVNP
ncbi:MAG: hypothetical protein IJ695_03010 [Butyrivibrio sp.]|nr:hypothetical protein [Butyrivibrio sp.]